MTRVAWSAMRALICVVVVTAASVGLAEDDARPAAVPYRPTITTPAALSAPLWLESEFGVQAAPSPGEVPRRSSAPYSLKYAFSEDWGIRINGEALVHTNDGGERGTGVGDTGLVAKRRLALNEDSAFGLEVGVLFPTARPLLQLGSGKPDYSVNGIYSADVNGWHGDLNLIGTRLGSKVDAQGRWQETAAASLSHPVSERWSLVGELAGTRQHGVSSTSQFLGALAWAVRRDVVLDVGAIRGLNRATSTWQVFTGATVVVGRID